MTHEELPHMAMSPLEQCASITSCLGTQRVEHGARMPEWNWVAGGPVACDCGHSRHNKSIHTPHTAMLAAMALKGRHNIKATPALLKAEPFSTGSGEGE